MKKGEESKEEKKPEGSLIGGIVALVGGLAIIYYSIKLFFA